MKRTNWDFEQKNLARTLALSSLKKVSRVASFLPSYTCKDIKESLANGKILRTNYLVLIENDKSNVGAIEKFLKKEKITNYYLHIGDVHTLDLSKVLKKGQKIDFMFLDICGNLVSEIADWLYRSQDYFTDDMVMPITVQIAPRGKRPKKRGRKGKNRMSVFADIVDRCTQNIEYPIDTYGRKNNFLSCTYIHTENLLRDMRISCKTLFHAFSKRNIIVSEIMVYRDRSKKISSNMAMINLSLCGKKKEDKTFKKIISQCKVNKKKNSKKYKKTTKTVIFKNAYEIAKHLGIFGQYKTFDSIESSKRAWITIHAKRSNLCPVMVMEKVKNRIESHGLAA